MKVGVMITNGPGGHPPWKHAEVTADKLVVDPSPDAENYAAKANAAAELRYRVRQVLETHHDMVRGHELGKLKTVGTVHLNTPLLAPGADDVTAAITAIQNLTKGTVLEAHYAKPEVVTVMREILAHEFSSQQMIHRSEHADNNKNDQHAQTFKIRSAPGPHPSIDTSPKSAQ